MRILLIHSDYLKYKTKSKTKIAEKIDDNKKEGMYENALVVFTAVEKDDETDMDSVVENAINEIKDVLTDNCLNLKTVVKLFNVFCEKQLTQLMPVFRFFVKKGSLTNILNWD